MVNKKDAIKEYGIELIDKPKQDKYDAILLAVAHDVFRKFSLNEINLLGKGNYALYDVKYLFELNEVEDLKCFA